MKFREKNVKNILDYKTGKEGIGVQVSNHIARC